MDCSMPSFPVFHYLWSLLKLMSTESMMPSNHLILCCPLLLRSTFPSIRVFSNELALRFYILAFVNNAVVNTDAQISHGDPAFRSFGHTLRSGIGESDCNPMLIFLGNTMLFSLVAAPFYLPTNSAQAFQFHHIHRNIFSSLFFFDSSHPNRCELVAHCAFDLHFPTDWWCFTSFHLFLGH